MSNEPADYEKSTYSLTERSWTGTYSLSYQGVPVAEYGNDEASKYALAGDYFDKGIVKVSRTIGFLKESRVAYRRITFAYYT